MDENGTWTLSPAYDITHAHDEASKWTSKHLMGVNGKFREIDRRDLMEFAERHQVRGAAVIITDVADALRGWDDYAQEARIPESTAAEVKEDFQIDELTKR